MLLQIFEMAKKVDYLENVGYHYELTENSASRSGYTEATLRAYEHFKLDRELVYRLHPDMGKDVDNYLVTEYMACIVAMGRNKVYNKEMIKEIKSFVRKMGRTCQPGTTFLEILIGRGCSPLHLRLLQRCFASRSTNLHMVLLRFYWEILQLKERDALR